jgi:drug/metabolite transporter (DMT)-like permease
MLWLPIAIGAYLLYALAALGDKALLAGSFKTPATYAMFVGVGGLIPFVVLALVIGIPVPSFAAVGYAFVSGILFILALLPYYRGIQRFEVSRIVPATGGLVPIFTFILGIVFLPGGDSFTPLGLVAFAILICGSVLLSIDRAKRVSAASIRIALLASLLFASSFLLLKSAYLLQSLWSGLLWVQMGAAVTGIALFLILRDVREDVRVRVRGNASGENRKTLKLFLATQASAAGASILQHAAFYLAPAALFAFVNALQGVQYLFLLVLAVVLSRRFPALFNEETSKGSLVQKGIGIALIVLGLVALIVGNTAV